MRKIILVLMLVFPTALMAQKGNYTLKGKVGNLNAPAKIYLKYLTTSDERTDSTTMQNGQFEFKGSVNDPILAVLLINRKGMGVLNSKKEGYLVFLDSGIIMINTPDSLTDTKAKVTGSKINADWETLMLAMGTIKQKENAFMVEYKAIYDEKKKDETNMINLTRRKNAFQDEYNQLRVNFIKTHPNSFISLFLLEQSGRPDYSQSAPLFNALSGDVKNTESGKKYAANLEKVKVFATGVIAPEFSLNDTEGKPIKLSDFKGKYVLVDFWASWCGPCRAENPNVVQAYSKYHDKGLEIIGVSLDTNKEAWLKAISDDKLPWKHVSDLKGYTSEVIVLYAISGVPQNVLIDPTGKIVANDLKGYLLENKLAEIFK